MDSCAARIWRRRGGAWRGGRLWAHGAWRMACRLYEGRRVARLSWQKSQIIGAGVLLRAALGVMDINPFLLRRRFNRMARNAKALEKVTFKSGGADRAPRYYMIYMGGLRYSATAKASAAKRSRRKLRGAYGLPCGRFIWGVVFIAGGALLWLAAVCFTKCGALRPRFFTP